MGEKEHANSMLIIIIINNVSRFVAFDEKRNRYDKTCLVCVRAKSRSCKRNILQMNDSNAYMSMYKTSMQFI